MTAKAWSIFKKFRIVIFALSATLCVGLIIVHALYLAREWQELTNSLRALILGFMAVHLIGSILLYLMVVMHFKRWLDAARVSFFMIFQFGLAVVFAIFQDSLPCRALGSQSLCNSFIQGTVYGSWVLTGLLFSYLFSLAAMTCVPKPVPCDPEETLYRPSERLAIDSPESPTLARTTDHIPSQTSQERNRGPILPFAHHGNHSTLRPLAPVMTSNNTISGQPSGSRVNPHAALMYRSSPAPALPLPLPSYHRQRSESSEKLLNPIQDTVAPVGITLSGARTHHDIASARRPIVNRSQHHLSTAALWNLSTTRVQDGHNAPGINTRERILLNTTPAALIPGLRSNSQTASPAGTRPSMITNWYLPVNPRPSKPRPL